MTLYKGSFMVDEYERRKEIHIIMRGSHKSQVNCHRTFQVQVYDIGKAINNDIKYKRYVRGFS